MIKKTKEFIVKNYISISLILLIILIVSLVFGFINKSADIVIIIFGLIFYFVLPIVWKKLKMTNFKFNDNLAVVMIFVIAVLVIIYTIVFHTKGSGMLGVLTDLSTTGPTACLIIDLSLVKILKQNSD